jgi:L-arabinokinase
LRIHVVSRLPAGFLDSQLDPALNSFREESFDVGMVQIDSIRVDVPSTLERISALYSRRHQRVEAEADFLRKHDIRLVVTDIPAIPIAAAAAMGIPRIAVGNFAWDWIYSEFLDQDARWPGIVNAFREDYVQTDMLLRLPFCGEMESFPYVEDIPLVATPGKSNRDAIAAWTGRDPRKKWILLSFTSLDFTNEALAEIEGIEGYEFYAVSPLAWPQSRICTLDRRKIAFADVVASMDAVISKPGFGILSDCIANDKPLIYADRSNFLEYPILVEAIRKYIRHVHIPAPKLYSGHLAESLKQIWDAPPPPSSISLGGDRIAAQRIIQYV